jgi:hypothetical protein
MWFEPYGTAATFGWDAVAAFAGGAVVVWPTASHGMASASTTMSNCGFMSIPFAEPPQFAERVAYETASDTSKTTGTRRRAAHSRSLG